MDQAAHKLCQEFLGELRGYEVPSFSTETPSWARGAAGAITPALKDGDYIVKNGKLYKLEEN